MSEDHVPHAACRARKAAPEVSLTELSSRRAKAIRLVGSRWVNGTELTYHFLDLPGASWPDNQKQIVRDAFAAWKGLGIGLSFREVADRGQAMLRIGFHQGDGSWSWVGTEVLRYQEPDGRNMNFGWDLATQWGWATALHEIGHALGMAHEHQNPIAGIIWDEPQVYARYGAPPNNWNRDDTYHNIIRKLKASEVEGSNWDPRSVMHYPIGPGLIRQPAQYSGGTPENVQLSANDIAWARRFFPPMAAAMPIEAGANVALANVPDTVSEFSFTADATREFVLQSTGSADTVIVLHEIDGEARVQIAASNDTGTPDNARIATQLTAGQRYIASVRTNYAEPGSSISFGLT
jgi:hypothetical protein